MTLGILLAPGDSFEDMAKSGQDIRFKKRYLGFFSKEFSSVYIFSYANEKVRDLPKNVYLIPNKYNLHRYIYSVTLPIVNMKYFTRCDVFRAYHLSGTIPAIISKILYKKKFAFNYAYDYQKFATIESKYLQAFLFKLIEPAAIFFATKIFAANKKIDKSLPRDKSVYLPNGIDTNLFKPVNKINKNKVTTIISVGRLEKQKNFDSLIRAMKGIKAKLIIIGSGSQKDYLLKIAHQQSVNLKIIDKVMNAQMPKIYNGADIFILPSSAEGSPKALLEAMACGLPVIGAKSEGITELIQDNKNGKLAETTSENISLVLKEILSEQDARQKMGVSAKDYIRNFFSLSTLLEREANTLKNL